MDEFSLINKYFSWTISDSVDLGIGDDGAICHTNGERLVITTDTLIAGVHFLANTSSGDIAYKALAVSLSDIAAMGATPKWFSLALSIDKIDNSWLRGFSKALQSLAVKYNLSLIGGDTTCGSLSITITIIGLLPTDKALLRSTAKFGDRIFVSNTIGDAGLALSLLKENKPINKQLLNALNRPKPQLELGLELINIANSCIDISDGLLADLGHILSSSNVGAVIDITKVPLSIDVKNYIAKTNNYHTILTTGDDYQLCWTINSANMVNMIKLKHKFNFTEIGIITKDKGLKVVKNSHPVNIGKLLGYQHFKD